MHVNEMQKRDNEREREGGGDVIPSNNSAASWKFTPSVNIPQYEYGARLA